MNIQNAIDAAEHLTGFVIVIMALMILWGITAAVGRIFIARAARAAVTAPPRAAVSSVAPVVEDELDDDLVVVAAAVATMLGSSHRIVAVKPSSSSWGRQGRSEIHASHRIR